jgi:hypothetical protein
MKKLKELMSQLAEAIESPSEEKPKCPECGCCCGGMEQEEE